MSARKPKTRLGVGRLSPDGESQAPAVSGPAEPKSSMPRHNRTELGIGPEVEVVMLEAEDIQELEDENAAGDPLGGKPTVMEMPQFQSGEILGNERDHATLEVQRVIVDEEVENRGGILSALKHATMKFTRRDASEFEDHATMKLARRSDQAYEEMHRPTALVTREGMLSELAEGQAPAAGSRASRGARLWRLVVIGIYALAALALAAGVYQLL